MPVTKTILKNTKRQAAVKLVGTGQATINIYELAYVGANTLATGSSIRLHDQSVTPANVSLQITDLYYDVSGSGNITRNSNISWAINAGVADYKFAQDSGIVLDQAVDANANVIVNIGGATDGTVLIQFSKSSGYNDLDLQNFQDFQK